MTKLAFVTADLARKREELEQSMNRVKLLEEALEENAAERQRLMVEVSGLTDNNYDEANHTGPHLKIVDLEEKVAILEAQLQTKEQEVAKHQEKGLATQQILSFWFTNCFGNDPMPDGALELVQAMAAAKSPERLHDINDCRIFDILPPLISGVRPPHVVPQRELEMVLKVHSLLSSEPDEDDLATLIVLISNLTLRQPTSAFHPITVTFGSLWNKMDNVPVDSPLITRILLALLHFSMLQLKVAGNARFCSGTNGLTIPRLPNSTIAVLAEGILGLEGKDVASELPVKLVEICRKRSRSGPMYHFHHERCSNRGWFGKSHDEVFFLVDFKMRSIRLIDRDLSFFCEASVGRQQTLKWIDGHRGGEVVVLAENISEETRKAVRKWLKLS
jgi:hypothetical protein